MNWKQNIKDLGEVKKKTTINIVFEGTPNMKGVAGITASCGCTVPVFDAIEKTLSVSFKTGIIPFHLRKQGYYMATKKLVVTYTDGEKEELIINAKIVN